MSIVIGVTTTIESQSLTLDLNALVTRVAKLLRRDDLNDEITQWVNFAQRELTDKVGFPELRRTVQTTMLNGVWFYDLPIDFTREEKMYWLDDTVTPSVGRNLDPLPRSYYEEAGIEPRLNVSVPTPGEPLYYLIRKFRIGPKKKKKETYPRPRHERGLNSQTGCIDEYSVDRPRRWYSGRRQSESAANRY